jgi:hypothetical protein
MKQDEFSSPKTILNKNHLEIKMGIELKHDFFFFLLNQAPLDG